MKFNNENFMWGVASSAFQVEGHVENDMTNWEKEGYFKHNGKNPMYGNGANHWKFWEKDLVLLKKLNVNAYRFSMEWARIEPEPGIINKKALKKYSKIVNKLIENNITPVLTLHHFTHPKWFHQICPWHEEQSIDYFVKYVKIILKKFSDQISWFITFNEPLVWLLAAYGDAKFPPGEKDFNKLMRALMHMLLAHKKLYKMIKEHNSEAQVGLAKNFIIFRPNNKYNVFDIALNNLAHSFYNMMLIKAFQTNNVQFNFPLFFSFNESIELNNTLDFFGINYYYRMHTNFKLNMDHFIDLRFKKNEKHGNSDLGWEIYPKGLSKIVKWIEPLKLPIIITENGIAAEKDEKRIRYLKIHLKRIKKLKKRGIPLLGYFHWAFLDNYEWLEGQSARFGLVHVNYSDNYIRKIKSSGKFYADFIKSKT